MLTVSTTTTAPPPTNPSSTSAISLADIGSAATVAAGVITAGPRIARAVNDGRQALGRAYDASRRSGEAAARSILPRARVSGRQLALARRARAAAGIDVGRARAGAQKLGTIASWGAKGLGALGATVTAIDQYRSSPATTEIGKLADGAIGAGVGTLFEAAVTPIAVLDAATGACLSHFLRSGSRAAVTLAEAAITGDTSGIEAFHRASLAGENTAAMRITAESAQYWADHGINGTFKDLAREVRSML